jgi:hypothetical protein
VTSVCFPVSFFLSFFPFSGKKKPKRRKVFMAK